MRAVVFQGPGKMAVKDVPYPTLTPKKAIMKVKACGICGTDLHIYHGHFITRFPLVPGHEMSGEVVEVGSEVTNVKVGDRVTVDNAYYCGECYFCRTNQQNFCLDFRSQGCTENGGFAEYVAVEAKRLYDIGDLSFEEAAFTEPTACVVHGLRKIDLQLGDRVALFGAGPIGLLMLQMLKRAGASYVVVADPNQWKLDKAIALGANEVVLVTDRKDFSAVNKRLKELAPLGFNVVIDATGVPKVVENAFKLVINGGKIHFFGVCPNNSQITVNPYDVFLREIKAIGTFAQLYTFTYAVDLLRDRAINVKTLISHEFPLTEFEKAFDVAQHLRDRMKILVKP